MLKAKNLLKGILTASLVFMVAAPAFAVDLNKQKFNEVVKKGKKTFAQRGNKKGTYSKKGTSSRKSLNAYTSSVLNSVQHKGLSTLRSSSGNSRDLYDFLTNWITSWEQSADYSSIYNSGYADKYHASFYSAYKNMYKTAWMKDKNNKAAAKSWIQVKMLDVGWEFINGGNAAVIVFDQVYRSNTYVDRGIKYLYLVRQNGSWKILREEQPDYVKLCEGSCSEYYSYD